MQLRSGWLFLLFGACGVYGADADPPPNAETRLQEKLRKISRAVGRQYLRRPGKPAFTINGTMAGMQLEKVDEGTSLLEMSLQFKYAYFHPNLTWNPAEFEGITQTSLTFDELSAPRVAGCYAAAYTAVPDGVFEIFVYSDGYVEIASDAAVKNKCLLDNDNAEFELEILEEGSKWKNGTEDYYLL
ncbi:hypothetical protein PRIPAC_93024 [Pristionchus pacificus]|uniref:Transmembrane ion channel n=1 Tax=Pristionchus pacificus TaxID=54126 RepID=A0A2A6CIF3_PRIPA|nr:hypothetical protein PRIPAC_93024 [Pristionchus pacificus]|eukprot:PDM77919.1 transmembrane ion channel [Pristionchus pacificus]